MKLPKLNFFKDWLLEQRINQAAHQDMNNPENWQKFVALVNQRSPDAVRKMESDRGLI